MQLVGTTGTLRSSAGHCIRLVLSIRNSAMLLSNEFESYLTSK